MFAPTPVTIVALLLSLVVAGPVTGQDHDTTTEARYRLAIEGGLSVLPDLFPAAPAGIVLVEVDSTARIEAAVRSRLQAAKHVGRTVLLTDQVPAGAGCPVEPKLTCPSGGYPFVLRISFLNDSTRGLIQVSACLEHRGPRRAPDALLGCRETFFVLKVAANGALYRTTPVMIRGEPRTTS